MAEQPNKQGGPRREGRPGERPRGQRQGGGRDEGGQYIEKLVGPRGGVRRVSKVSKGGRRMSYSTLGVVGDGAGKVGVGQGKAREVPSSIQKAFENARRNMFEVPLIGSTIPHQVNGRASGAHVLLKPASPGTGVIAGAAVRAVVEAAGIKDILAKSLGSANPTNIAHATIQALKDLQSPQSVALRRGKPVEEIAPSYLLKSPEDDGQSYEG